MSNEEWQVALDEWFKHLRTVHDELWDMDKAALEETEHDAVLKITNIVNKLMRDMDVLRWSDADRDHAFTVIAGYVTQSNVERQSRRDADLARHKEMIEREAQRKIAEGVGVADHRAQLAHQNAEAARREMVALRENCISQIDSAHAAADERIAQHDASFEQRVAQEVARRLTNGVTDLPIEKRRRPLIIG